MTRQELSESMDKELGPDFTYSYFSRSGFTEATQTLYPWSLVANDKFRREARRFLEREGVTLGKPNPAHMQPGAKPVIFNAKDYRQ